MFRYTALILTICGLCCFSSLTYAQLASSTFDTDQDRWLSKTLPFLNSGAPPNVLATYTPSWSATGGNPGGYITQSDPDVDTSYWYAPAKFLGNKSAAYQGSLSFDLIQTSFSGAPYNQEEIMLIGNGHTLAFDTPNNPTATWTHDVVGLVDMI